MAATSTVTLSNGLMLSCFEQGQSSDPALVLLPGPTDSWRSYRTVLEHIPRSIRVLAVSLRGHGDSDKPPSGYRVENYAADVIAFLDVLAIRRAVLVGHSGSCLVARRVAIDAPERVAGLVLEAAPTTLKGDPGLTEFVGSVVSTIVDPIDPAFARSFALDTSSTDVSAGTLDIVVEDLLKVPARVWRETFAALLDHDDRHELDRIAAPLLLIWGENDGLIGRDVQEQLLRLLPQATLTTYAGVGHTPRWEQPVRFASDLVAFVEQLRAGSAGRRET
jgi:pimeloyl-ACP methyl ester carboxylesterase